jgi:uncharacterized protein (TIGR00288 family)
LAAPNTDEQRIALFIDFENIAIGVRDAHYRKFDINLVLERLLDKGKLLVKKAYADWTRYSDYKRSFHEAAIELIEVPQKSVGGKNSADIRLVVDAMDLSFQKEHINCFVVASGDSDFSPLVSKLKENDKHVIGLGVKNSTSDLLTENCDEFIFYEDLVRARQRPMPQIVGNLPEKIQECFALLVDSVLALQRENKESLWGSMVKETMKRKRPSFNETYYGYRTFSHLLEDAQRKGIVILRRDQRSGSYVIEDLGSGASVGGQAAATAPPASAAPAARDARHTPPPSTVPADSTTEADGAVPSEDSEAAGEGAERGERGGRRRRGRGRRGRGGVGAETTAGAAEAGDAEESPESDEPEATEEEAAAEAGPGEAAAEEPRPRSRGERSLFSLFSWARREPAAPAESEPKKED